MGEAAQHRGTSPARSRLRQAAALLAGGVLLLGGVAQGATAHAAPGGTAGPGSAPARPGVGTETAAVSVTSLTPTVPAKGGTVTISGTVTNRGRSAITGAHVGVRMGNGGRSLSSRSALSEVVAKRTGQVSEDGTEVRGHTADLRDIPPGISVPFTLKVPVGALDLRGNGVYQLGVSVQGQTKAAPYRQALGIARTFLPWFPDPGDAKQTRVAMAWPLIDRPHIDARTDTDEQQTPIFRDDDLAKELAPGGRLQQLVATGKNLPITWVIDPDLLATVDAMAKGYRVAAGDRGIRGTRAGTGKAVAKQWLSELRAAVRGEPVVALPFADPDLASIAHKGKNVPGTLEHLRSASELAAVTTETVLGVTPRTDVAWPFDGAVDAGIVATAKATGADKVIASSVSMGAQRLNHTPNAPRPVGGGTTAVVADAGLAKPFEGDLSRADNSALAVQRFLADSLMVTLEAPNLQRSVLIAPRRMPDGSAAQAMGEALAAAQEGGWLDPVELATVEKATPDPQVVHAVPGSGSYPSGLRRQELSTQAFHQIQATQTSLEGFLIVLSHEERVITPFGTAVLRSMSNTWRGHAGEARAYRESVKAYLSDLKQAVRIINKSPVTLSGSSGTLQVTVENGLAQEINGLRLQLTSSQPNRLDVGDPEDVIIAGGHRRSLKFPTTANANGRVSVTAQLYTADGTPYGAPMKFKVNVTSVTGTVLIVIAFGMLLLVLAGLRMYRQRKRAALRAGEGQPEAGADPRDRAQDPSQGASRPADPADPTESTESAADERPGDPPPDTSADGAEAHTTDEKVER